MKKSKKTGFLLTIIVAAVLSACLVGMLIINILSLNRLEQNNDRLTAENAELTAKNTQLQNDFDDYRLQQETDTSFDYLAVGNSITDHPVYGGYWWGEWGMAASAREYDYFHRVSYQIAQQYTENSATALNLTVWEKPFYDRNGSLRYLDGYLSEDLDLVSVQLGENIQKPEEMEEDEYRMTLEADYLALINEIKVRAPKAQILVIGCFWENSLIDEVKQKICQETGAAYIPLTEIQGEGYRAGVGAQVLGDDDNLHTIESGGVGEHPNDEAMNYIAQKVMEHIPGLMVQ